jgi:hypothetical protein
VQLDVTPLNVEVFLFRNAQGTGYLVALLFNVCLFLVVTHLLHAGNLRVYLEAAEDGKLGPPASA